MNDFDNENEASERETDAEVVASGLVAREQFRPGASLSVVDDPGRERTTERLYREIPVRIDDTRTVLLVRPWCERQRRRPYRVRSVDAERDAGLLVTVEIVAQSDRERCL